MRRALLASAALFSLAMPAFGQSVDRNQVNRIIDEGTTHSQVMPIAEHLADVIGPRLTNSPQMRQAEAWTMAQFSKWGLKAVHREGFDFGRGWTMNRTPLELLPGTRRGTAGEAGGGGGAPQMPRWGRAPSTASRSPSPCRGGF